MIGRREFLFSLSVLPCIAATQGCVATPTSSWPVPPQVRREPRIVGNFGHRRSDDYTWLKPEDWQAVLRDPASLAADIKSALQAENDYAAAMLEPSLPLQRRLAARMLELEADKDVPIEIEDGEFVYYRRVKAASDYPIYVRRRAGGGEQVLLDVAAEAADKKYYALSAGGPLHSADHRLLGWAADSTGSGIFAIRVRDIENGRMIVANIDDAHGDFTFDGSGRYLFWVGRGAKGWPNAVWRRDLKSGADVRILSQDDPAFFVSLRTTASGGFIVIHILNGEQSEVYLVPSAEPTAAPRLIEPRVAGLSYDVDHWNDRLVILTNADGASDFKLMTAPVETPSREHWQELVPHVPGRFIAAIHPFSHHLVRVEWRDALPRLVVMAQDGSERDTVFEEPAYAIDVPRHQGFAANTLTFVYQSPKTQPRPRRVLLGSGVTATEAVPRNRAYDPLRYVVERIEAIAGDGQRIPITILTMKDARRDGSRPLYLSGYGSYGVTYETEFSPAAITLVEQGWTYAIAHVRGGAERGSRWWHSVLKHGKRTTFTDFIACAEHLIANRYTAARRIVAQGLSAGGLLMGAVYTMRPDLWVGVIAQVPFLDVLNSMDDFQNHPLGATALPIWGDPRVPEDYAYMAGYSPYDQLKPSAYPALLATGSVADDRVAFWEPVKFAAKARALTLAGNPIMALTDMTAGHAGASGASAARERQARFQAFAIWAAERRWGDVPQRPE